MSELTPSRSLGRLLQIMATLRSPDGCPWDAEQTPETLQPYLLEEAYEVLQALDEGDPAAICEELGDLLLQIVFLSRIFEERGAFDMDDVIQSIAEKLERRHPHVFGDAPTGDVAALDAQWQRIKETENKSGRVQKSLFASIPRQMPALLRAAKVAENVSRAGLNKARPADIGSLKNLVRQLERAIQTGKEAAIQKQMGELLFAIAALGRNLKIDAERCLRHHIDLLAEQLEESV